MNNKNKKGVSSASIIVILSVVVTLISTLFVYTMRNSILVSGALGYTKSYNEASMAIDNARDTIKREINAMDESIRTEDVLLGLNYDIEVLYDVDIASEDIELNDSGIMNSMTIEISRRYDAGILYSVVNYSSNGGQLLIDEMFSHETIALGTGKEESYADCFRASDMAFAYWDEQKNSDSNYLIEKIQERDSNFDLQWEQVVRKESKKESNSRKNLIETMLNELYKGIEGAAEWSGNWINCYEKKNTPVGGNIIISGKKYKLDGLEEGSASSLTIKNDSIVCVSGNAIIGCDLYIEKGSTLIIKGDCDFKTASVDKKGNIKYENLKESMDIDTCKPSNSKYYGGGLITLGSVNYSVDGDAAIDSSDRIRGVIWSGKKVNFINEANKPIPLGATIYAGQGGEVKIVNMAYDAYRPCFIFCNSEVHVQNCGSEIVNGQYGLAFFIVSKVEFLFAENQKFKANFYLYLNDDEFVSEIGDFNNAWSNNISIVDGNSTGKNLFVSREDLVLVIEGINDWYIPPILRGQLILMAVSTTKLNK